MAHTSSLFSGYLLERRQNAVDFIGLQERVDSLMKVNAGLQSQLAAAQMVQVPFRDTFFIVRLDSIYGSDSLRRKIVRPYYEFFPARVISNNINSANNWLMINRGSDNKVAPGLGVVSPKGVVGIVRYVNRDFSIVMSILHRQTKISAALKKQGAFGSLVWEGGDPSLMTLRDIPKHHLVKEGDTVLTSRLSQKFPPNLYIGRVSGTPEKDPENPYFQIMKVRLNQDMSTISDVQVVLNPFLGEIDSLTMQIKQ
jgi:rod shape-determining protein MreC